MERNIYVIGDIHGDFNLLKARFYMELNEENSQKRDVLFVAGDAGFINSYEGSASKEKRKSILNRLPFIIIVVLGNHENYDIIESLPETTIFNGRCYKEEGVNAYYAKNGQIFDIDGTKIFTFNGGLSVDKKARLELEKQYNRKFYWPQEIKEEDFEEAYNNYFNHQVDYVITHDVPLSIFKQIMPFVSNSNKNEECALQPFFQRIYAIDKFKHWYAGHYHPNFLLNIDIVSVLPIGYLLKIK